MKQQTRNREEIATQVEELGIDYAYHGDWIWLFGIGPNPHKKCKCDECQEASRIRNAVKELGFKYKHREDHVNDDPEDQYFMDWDGRGSRWSHSCEKPTRFRRTKKKKKEEDNEEKSNIKERMAALSWD